MNELQSIFTHGYEETRAIIERFIPETLEDAEAQADELRRLEFLYESMMYHMETSVACEQIIDTFKNGDM